MRKDSKILTDIGGSRLSVRRPAAGRRLPACALVLCIASFLLATSCQRKEVLMPEYNAVVTILDGSSTRAIPKDSDPQINDIAIFAFSGQELVGYIYESGLAVSGKTIFPMTLTKGGAIDFYVIANSEPGFFKVVAQNGDDVKWSRTSTVNPPAGVTPDDLEACKVTLGDRNAAGPWYAPMTNLPGAGGGNRTFDVDGMTRIPIELTRAVSKVEVWFRTLGDVIRDDPENGDVKRTTSKNPPTIQLSSYYCIDRIKFSMPVKSAGIYSEVPSSSDQDYDSNNPEEKNIQESFNYETAGKPNGFQLYDPDDIPDNFYSENYFYKIWKYYIFPNMFGGNGAGVVPDGDQEDLQFSTKLTVAYSHKQKDGEYKYLREEGWGWDKHYYWIWEIKPPKYIEEEKEKDIYLPACERNQAIRVWCALNDEIDRSFTYTVVDWDETVTVNVPDFN